MLVLVLAAPVLAQVDQGRAVAAVEAARDLAVAIHSAPDAAAAPRAADPRYAPLFDAALDATLTGEEAADPAGMALLHDMQREAGQMLKAYLLAGTSSDGGAPSAGDKAAAAGNFLAFLPEIGRIYDFRARIGAQIARGCNKLGDAGGQMAAAIEAIAGEQESILLATVALAGDQQLEAAWRRERMEALTPNASDFSALLGKKRSQEIADIALMGAIRESDPQLAAALKNFALAMLR